MGNIWRCGVGQHEQLQQGHEHQRQWCHLRLDFHKIIPIFEVVKFFVVDNTMILMVILGQVRLSKEYCKNRF